MKTLAEDNAEEIEELKERIKELERRVASLDWEHSGKRMAGLVGGK